MAEIKVTRADFDDLKDVVKELAEAQKRTEYKLEELAEAQSRTEVRLKELAEAQKRTEARMEELAEAQSRTEARLEELAEAQSRTEARLEELAEAQSRTEARLEELAEAQKRTEARMEELAEAQQRTETELQQLARQVGSLSATMGFGLEDIARVCLPGYLERNQGVKIDKLTRKYVDVGGEPVEIDLFGSGTKAGRPVTVIGEVKARIYSREIKAFARKVARVRASLEGEILKVMFGYLIHPSASELASREGIILVASYER
jgi:vacuolar-type H+-ATPase subunit I/STV1